MPCFDCSQLGTKASKILDSQSCPFALSTRPMPWMQYYHMSGAVRMSAASAAERQVPAPYIRCSARDAEELLANEASKQASGMQQILPILFLRS